ncbi:MAG: c-type cytochrome [Chloroflexi bacterium]|nr:c-type cytochrome [Chloroflexota bacterium]
MKSREDYRFQMWLTAVFAVTTMLLVGLYTLREPARMLATERALEQEAIERAEVVWEQDCATCHGKHGEGVRNSGPALNTQEFLKEATDEIIFNTINDGRPGTSMPAWGQPRGGPYNAQVIDDLVKLIRSWEPTAPSVAEMKPEGDPTQGAVLFATTCFACHGVAGEGTSVGLRLNDPARLARFSDDYYRDVIQFGRPDRGMPTWGSVLSPQQIEDLVAYIRSWETEPPVAMAQLGGDAMNGRDIFQATCATCHGRNGQGTDIAPPLAEAPILADADALYETISHGRIEAGMPNWGQVLSPAEINDVIAYLGTLKAGEAPAEETQPDAGEQDQALGRAQFLYVQHCATCHGLQGEGTEDRPPLANSEYIQTNTDEAIISVIANGRPNTPMEGFSNVLSQEEILGILELLRSWQ